MSLTQSHQTISQNTTLTGELPKNFTLILSFNHGIHVHTHRFNAGGKKIFIDIEESYSDISTGKIIQSVGTYDCFIKSRAFGLSGSFEIERTSTIYGDKSTEDLHKELRDNIKTKLVNEIQNLWSQQQF